MQLYRTKLTLERPNEKQGEKPRPRKRGADVLIDTLVAVGVKRI
jgi:hypothetical protein